MGSRTNFTIRDYSNELSSFGVNSIEGNAGNLAAQLSLAAALSSAIENLTIGHLDKYTYSIGLLNSPVTPSNVYAQREMKWLVSYTGDVSGKTFQVEIAAPEITGNVAPNTDIADLGSTDWAAFVTAFEAYVRSPDDDAETVTVQSARVVGRNI